MAQKSKEMQMELLQGTLDLLILRTLESTGQNKTRAAEILGISLKTMHNKLKEYSLAQEDLLA